MKRQEAETHIINAENLARTNARRIARGAPPIPSDPPSTGIESAPASNSSGGEDTESLDNLKTLVSLVEDEGWEDFGFVLIRTYYSDESLWEHFLDKYCDVVDEGLDAAPPASGIERIRDRVLLRIVSDEALANASPAQVALAYRLCAEEVEDYEEDERLQPGLHTRMCLMVDEECMRSVVDRNRDVNSPTVPFLKAVDIALGEEELTYTGVFKVALASLITKFYPALLGCRETADLVQDGIWGSC